MTIKISPENTEAMAFRDLMTPKLHDDLDRALTMLSPLRREVFIAHFVDGVPYEKLSRDFGKTEKRIRSIASSARNQLQNVTSLRQYLDMLS